MCRGCIPALRFVDAVPPAARERKTYKAAQTFRRTARIRNIPLSKERKMKVVYDDGGRSAAGYKGKARDCVARAIAIVSGRPYKEIYRELANGTGEQRATKRTSKRSASARNGINTGRKWFREYMRGLGFVWTPCMKIGTGCKVHLADGELPMGRLVVALSRHYTAVIDGVIHDTLDPQRDKSRTYEPDRGQVLKPNQGRNQIGVWTEVGGRCVYGYWAMG